MYEDMMIQELTEDQLEQVVGGKKRHASGGVDPSVTNSVSVTNVNGNSNSNTNSATSSSTSSATGGTATASTGAITVPLITI
jgi:bacteriocin-like protein